jgi:hypothetical protein
LVKKLEVIRNVLKNTKRRRPTAIFCPRCCSPKIELNSSLAVWLTPKEYHCPECGYTGMIIMELEEEPKNQPKEASTEDKTSEETNNK